MKKIVETQNIAYLHNKQKNPANTDGIFCDIIYCIV